EWPLGTVGGVDVDPLPAEGVGDGVGDGRLVLGDQYARAHLGVNRPRGICTRTVLPSRSSRPPMTSSDCEAIDRPSPKPPPSRPSPERKRRRNSASAESCPSAARRSTSTRLPSVSRASRTTLP